MPSHESLPIDSLDVIPFVVKKPKETIIDGETLINGTLRPDQLHAVSKGHQLTRLAALSFTKMMEQAATAGILYIFSSTYRECGAPGDGKKYLVKEAGFTQWAAWELYQMTLNKEITGFNLASDPTGGCSGGHGFGIGIDIYMKGGPSFQHYLYKLANDKIREETIWLNPKGIKMWQDITQTWIVNNGPQYGWAWTGANFGEPWHFDYDWNKDSLRDKTLVYKPPTEINNATKKNDLKLEFHKTISRVTDKFRLP